MPMTRFLYILLTAVTVAVVANGVTSLAQQQNQPQPPPPLTQKQIFDMVGTGLNSVDILVEAKLRGLQFVVDAESIADLTELGADDLLLNWLGLYSVELQPLYAQCLMHQQEQRHARVVEVTSDLLAKSPRLLHVYLIRGGALRAQDNLNEANEDFRKVIELHPKNSRARLLLGESLIAQGEHDEAIEHLEWITDHRSPAGIQDWPMAHRLLGEAFMAKRHYRRASAELHTSLWQLPTLDPEAIALMPDVEPTMPALAHLLSRCPDPAVQSPAAAIEIANLMKLLSTTNDHRQQALLRLAEAQAAAGDFDDAVATQKAAELISSSAETTSIRERLEMYQNKDLPMLPAGVAEPADPSSPTSSGAVVERLLQRMVAVDLSASIPDKPDPFATKGQPVPFRIGQYEVTRGEWADVMGTPRPANKDLPIDRISWDDCQIFLLKLNETSNASGVRFRLPMASEWKAAVERERTSPFFFGDDDASLKQFGWFAENSGLRLHAVGALEASPSGLFDVYGNVAEWCGDVVSLTEESADSTDGKTTFRAVAGGSFLSSSDACRTDAIGFARQSDARRGLGFRLVAEWEFTETSPGDAQAMPQVAATAGLTRAINDARRVLETELFQRPWLQERLFTLLYLQAVVRGSTNDTAGAVENLRALIREMSDDNSSLMHLTRCHLAWILATDGNADARQIEEAGKIVEAMLSRTEFRQWLGYFTQSAVLAAANQWDDAERRAMQANDLAPAQFKDLCQSQLRAIRSKKAGMTREFPISPVTPPTTVVPIAGH